jgi:hypothetical protein
MQIHFYKLRERKSGGDILEVRVPIPIETESPNPDPSGPEVRNGNLSLTRNLFKIYQQLLFVDFGHKII